jgi:hypothetical protein
MVVTIGVVLLTVSFTLISVDRVTDDREAEHICDGVVGAMLNDPAVARSPRLLDNRSLGHFDFVAISANWSGGLKVMLSYSDGPAMVLFDSGGEAGAERICRSEPVNVYHHQADVRAALLTVWVWK